MSTSSVRSTRVSAPRSCALAARISTSRLTLSSSASASASSASLTTRFQSLGDALLGVVPGDERGCAVGNRLGATADLLDPGLFCTRLGFAVEAEQKIPDPGRHARRAFDMADAGIRLKRAALRHASPNWTEQDVDTALERWLLADG
jgi:hypothetical protein